MKAVVAVLVAAAVAVGLAAALVPSRAATVGGVAISEPTLDRDLSAIAHSPLYSCILTGSPTGTSGAGSGGVTGIHGQYANAFVGQWLRQAVVDQVAASLVRRKGLRVTSIVTRWARAALDRQLIRQTRALPTCHGGTAQSLLATLPPAFVDQQVAAMADTVALAFSIAGVTPTTRGLATYYAPRAAQFNRVCLSVIGYITGSAATLAAQTVASITSGTLTLANAVAAARVAPSAPVVQVSCGNLLGTLSTPFAGGAVGTLVGPVQGTEGYVLSEVTSSDPRSFAEAQTDVVTSIITKSTVKVDRALEVALKHTAITLDPRYGTFSTSGVVPPPSPPRSALLTAPADTP